MGDSKSSFTEKSCARASLPFKKVSAPDRYTVLEVGVDTIDRNGSFSLSYTPTVAMKLNNLRGPGNKE